MDQQLVRPVFQLVRRKVCYHCDTPNAPKLCARCLVARYCDAHCQRRHWPDHKRGCRLHAEAMSTLTELTAEKISLGSAFLDIWRRAIIRWAVYCINLGARPADFLARCT